MVKEQAIAKINKMGKIGAVLANIMKVCLFIGLGGLLVGMVVVMALPKDFIRVNVGGTARISVDLSAIGRSGADFGELDEAGLKGDLQMDMQGMNFRFDEVHVEGDTIIFEGSGGMGEPLNIRSAVYVMAAALVVIVMALISVFFAGALCRAFRDCRSPFEENVIKKMQNFAYSLIPWAVLGDLPDMVGTLITPGLTKSDGFSIELNMVLLVLVILALAYIFKYGAVLQQEADETL